jgi:hypothetical protein
VLRAGIGRSWLCVGQGQGVFKRNKKTEMMKMCGGNDNGWLLAGTSATAHLRRRRRDISGTVF